MDIGTFSRETPEGVAVNVYRKTALCSKADLAVRMIERWGVVVAEPDGEDSAGRQKLRMLSEIEVVQRACNMADLAIIEFESRGWVLALPTPDL